MTREKMWEEFETGIIDVIERWKKRLEQEPFNIDTYCEEHFCVIVDKDVWETAEKALKQEPCDDAISRQAVKDKYRESLVNNLKDDNRGIDLSKYAEEPYKAFCEFIDSISPVKSQEPKTGKWKVVSDGYGDNAYICECSECKDTVWVYKVADRKWNYCPNCGAKMKEGD